MTTTEQKDLHPIQQIFEFIANAQDGMDTYAGADYLGAVTDQMSDKELTEAMTVTHLVLMALESTATSRAVQANTRSLTDLLGLVGL